jgi:hypothetical protein
VVLHEAQSKKHPTLPWGALAAFVYEAPVTVSPKLWSRCTAVSPELWPHFYSIPQIVEGSTCPGRRLPVSFPCPRATLSKRGHVDSVVADVVEAAHAESGRQSRSNFPLV